MQNYEQIFKEFGIEIPEEHAAALKAKMDENYKTSVDWKKAADKRDEYKRSLDDTLAKLQGIENEDVDGLKGKIETLTADLDRERQERQQEAARRTLESTIDGFMNERDENGELVRDFVNAITAKTIREELFKELQMDSAKGKSIADIFAGIITGEDGNELPNILVDKGQQQLENNKARFTQQPKSKPKGGTITAEDFKGMSLDERIKLKQDNPELYAMFKKGE